MIWTEKVFAALRLSLGVFILTGNLVPAQASGPTIGLISALHAESIYRRILEHHWVESTGLFESFPDSSDMKLAQQASLYEQGAAGLLALRMGDLDRAQSLFHFLKDAWQNAPEKPGPHYGQRGLVNFYNAEFGSDGIEDVVHIGPNAWAALFAARLANQTHDSDALSWALDVEYWMANAVPHENGAVAMGPVDDPHGAPWARIFSTENNLSYDAFLTELLRSTQLTDEQRSAISSERDHVEHWLMDVAIDHTTLKTIRGTSPQGKDTIQALDTYTWMISAIGPRKLAQHGIDPDRFMAQAESAFEVTINGLRGVDPSDQTEADFLFFHDRAKPGEALRPTAQAHRMIWFEGLGQYILALSTMAEYSEHTGQPTLAAAYAKKAQQMTDQFDKGATADHAYPYATTGRFFRDGWRTPADSAHGPAASLISSVWRCFAGLGADPVAGRDVSAVQSVHVSMPKNIHVSARRPAVLYGTSEEMAIQAWNALNKNDWDQAIDQAKATLEEWSTWADQQEQRKMADVGHLVNYDGQAPQKNQIFKYWALNDVGAAEFVLGKAYDEKHDYDNAAKAFQHLADHYGLAQVWDPQGWFWSPLEAVRSDYVQRDPAHYGRLIAENPAEQSNIKS